MTKLQKVRVRLDNVHSDGGIFLSINGGQCYLLLERCGCEQEDILYIDENGKAYNKHNKPCDVYEPPRLVTSNDYKLCDLERQVKKIQKEIDCIRRGD